MAITKEQREKRRLYLGSSDMAAIMVDANGVGLDPFKSSYDVWLDKIGAVDDFEGNEATDRGNLLEPVLLNWAERELGVPIIRDVMLVDKLGLPLACNLDGDCPSLDAIVEAKTCGDPAKPMKSDEDSEDGDEVGADDCEWGRAWTDQVPMRTVVQTHVGMSLSGRKQAFIPLLSPGYKTFTFSMYIVRYDADLAKSICDAADAFWKNHVIPRIPPSNSKPSIEVLKRMRRVAGKTVTVPDDLARAFVETKEILKNIKAEATRAKIELLAAIGDAEAAEWAGGGFSYFEQGRAGIDGDLLRTKYPEIAQEVATESRFRVLRERGAVKPKTKIKKVKAQPVLAGAPT